MNVDSMRGIQDFVGAYSVTARPKVLMKINEHAVLMLIFLKLYYRALFIQQILRESGVPSPVQHASVGLFQQRKMNNARI